MNTIERAKEIARLYAQIEALTNEFVRSCRRNRAFCSATDHENPSQAVQKERAVYQKDLRHAPGSLDVRDAVS
jgi:hypothetical protein